MMVTLVEIAMIINLLVLGINMMQDNKSQPYIDLIVMVSGIIMSGGRVNDQNLNIVVNG